MLYDMIAFDIIPVSSKPQTSLVYLLHVHQFKAVYPQDLSE